MLTISGITYRVGGRLLLENASATIPSGSKVGLVGRNGVGKSTLFKLILGQLGSEAGSIDFPARARVGTVAQEAPGGPETLIETVIAAHEELAGLLHEAEHETDGERLAEVHSRLATLDGYSSEARAGGILAGLGFDAEAQKRPCSSFSGGWRMRVALAGLLFSEPDLLLLDEPTNYLDLEGVLWLEDFLKRYRYTVIIISHDRDLLNRSVDSILYLDRCKLGYYTGGYDAFETRLAADRMRLESEAKKIDAQRKHMQAFVDRFKAKASKAKQAQSRVKALAKLSPITLDPESQGKPIIFSNPAELSPPIIAIDDGAVGYSAGNPVLRKIDIRVEPTDRIALLGPNGNGKSTFSKLLAGRLDIMGGRMTISPKLTVGYFAQHQLDELKFGWTPYDHMRELMPNAKEPEVRKKLGVAGFSADKADNKVETLSGGEKARLLFALIGFKAPSILILDEPTNHLDIDGREALVRAIAEYEGAVILVSHDRHLLDASADQFWLVANGTVTPYDGDLDDYEAFVLSNARSSGGGGGKDRKADVGLAKEDRKAAAEKRKRLQGHKKAADTAEAQLIKLQSEAADIAKKLADPKLYGTGPSAAITLASLTQRDKELKKLIAVAEEAWLEAQSAYEIADAAE